MLFYVMASNIAVTSEGNAGTVESSADAWPTEYTLGQLTVCEILEWSAANCEKALN